MAKRKIVKIDESKCNGCGFCVPSCAEGAIQIIDGKARLVSDVYCDGLGACLGTCPQDAITIEEREAEAFDAKAAEMHMAKHAVATPPPHVCPGIMARSIARPTAPAQKAPSPSSPSELQNWPVQLHLVPPHAPYLEGARLLVCADCVPFAFGDFHRTFVEGRVVLIGCPKLDDGKAYVDKLAQIFSNHTITSIEVPRMEVPCCSGLVHIVGQALEKSGRSIPLTVTVIGIDGTIKEETELR